LRIVARRYASVHWEVGFGKKHAFFVLAFTTGLREGLESIVFLVGVISDVKDLSSLPIPIISALVLSRLVGCCFFQGTKKVGEKPTGTGIRETMDVIGLVGVSEGITYFRIMLQCFMP
jgi:high-affinity Fe2+/Pb2+ permease